MNILKELLLTRRNTLLAALVLVIADIFLLFFHYGKQAPEEMQLQAKLLEKTRIFTAGKGSDPSLIYSNGKADLATFAAGIPQKKDFARLVGEVYDRAERQGVAIRTISYKPVPKGEGGFVSYELSLDIFGKYPGLKKFLGELQALPQWLVVDNVGWTGGTPQDPTVGLRLQLTLLLGKEGA